MENLNILEAVGYLKDNATDLNLASAIADCFDDRLDKIEEIVPRSASEAERLENEIDTISEFSDLMMVVLEECKAYSKAVKKDANADDSKVLDVIQELELYLTEYDENFRGLENFKIRL